MTDQPLNPETVGEIAGATLPPLPPPSSPSYDAGDGADGDASSRPEIAVGAAFAGGFLLAMMLKRLAR